MQRPSHALHVARYPSVLCTSSSSLLARWPGAGSFNVCKKVALKHDAALLASRKLKADVGARPPTHPPREPPALLRPPRPDARPPRRLRTPRPPSLAWPRSCRPQHQPPRSAWWTWSSEREARSHTSAWWTWSSERGGTQPHQRLVDLEQ